VPRHGVAWPKARFNTAADLMMQLTAAEAQNRLKEYFNRAVLDPKLLVVDEIDYLPFGRDEEQDMPMAPRQLGSPGAGHSN
jgi:DNA replication protein DnaC